MSTGQRIQQARKAAGLSQKDLGLKLGVSGSMIGQYENDLRNPKLETLQKIATALDVPITYLLGTMNDEGAIDLGLTTLELSKRLRTDPSIVTEALNIVHPDYPISHQAFEEIKRTAMKLLMQKRMAETQERSNNHKDLDLGKLIAENIAENNLLSDIDQIAAEIKSLLSKLNKAGRREAINRITELTELPKYRLSEDTLGETQLS